MSEQLHHQRVNLGWIEVICGSMFSGKSEELIRRLRRAQIARQRVQIFKPKVDNRFSEDHIVSHSEMKIKSQLVTQHREILDLLDGPTQDVLVPAPRLLTAMVQHRLGHKDAARDTYNAAIAAFDWDPSKATNRESWIYHLLRREAEVVLASTP